MEKSECADADSLHDRLVDALFDENRDILVLTTETLEIIRTNQSASIYFGLSAESQAGRPIEALFDSKNQTLLKTIVNI